MRRALRAEWTKFRTLRSLTWTALAVLPLMTGLAVFVGVTGSLQPDDTVLGGSLTGAVPGQLAAAILGVLIVCGEYGSGMIRGTFTALPRRTSVLAAKAAVAAGVCFGTGLAAAACSYAAGSWLLSGQGYAQGDPMPALPGVALCLAATALLGVGAGTLLKHSAGAITAVVGFLLLPALLAPLFGDFQSWVSGASPQVVLQKMTQTSDVSGGLPAWPSLALLTTYALTLLAAATIRTADHDA